MPTRRGLSGRSLEPLLRRPAEGADRLVLTIVPHDTCAVASDGWRYLRYPDSSEELYDLHHDPHEWTNLVGDPKFRQRREQLARQVPATLMVDSPAAKAGDR